MDSIINYAEKLSIKMIISPKSNRKSKQKFGSALYNLQYIVENTFLKFKHWRGIAIRHFKASVFFRAFFICAISLSLTSLSFFVVTYFFLKLFFLKKFCLLLDKQKFCFIMFSVCYLLLYYFI